MLCFLLFLSNTFLVWRGAWQNCITPRALGTTCRCDLARLFPPEGHPTKLNVPAKSGHVL